MTPAVVSVVIKSDRLLKRFPRTGEIVRMDDRRGLYVVMNMDRERRVADLMQKGGRHEVEKDVPFASVRTVNRNISRAIEEFLAS